LADCILHGTVAEDRFGMLRNVSASLPFHQRTITILQQIIGFKLFLYWTLTTADKRQ
jgi:hypothetical protein